MEITIERARSDDASAILRLLEDNALPVDGVIDHLSTAVVARAEGRLVGSAALEMYPDGALLRSVAVDAALRGRGVGQRLTESALELATSLGASAVFLLKTTADQFFPKFAFRPISRSQVPESVQASVEFRSACPSSAIVMRRIVFD